MCEACRIRMELFGARDQRTLASVRVLEQVDKWAYRQVSASNKFKVLDREERKPNSLATSQAPHQWQIENDLREFLRSRGAEDRGSSLAAFVPSLSGSQMSSLMVCSNDRSWRKREIAGKVPWTAPIGADCLGTDLCKKHMSAHERQTGVKSTR